MLVTRNAVPALERALSELDVRLIVVEPLSYRARRFLGHNSAVRLQGWAPANKTSDGRTPPFSRLHGGQAKQPSILKSISGIKESVWTPIKYPDAIWDENKTRLISYTQVAEFPSPTFTSITAPADRASSPIGHPQHVDGQTDLFSRCVPTTCPTACPRALHKWPRGARR